MIKCDFICVYCVQCLSDCYLVDISTVVPE